MGGVLLMSSALSTGRTRVSFALLQSVLCLAILCFYLGETTTPASTPPPSSSPPPVYSEEYYEPSTELTDKLNGIPDGDNFYCFRGFKPCMSGIKQCIKPQQECDGIKDCDDGSDEGPHCKSFDCNATNRYRCPSGDMCMNTTDVGGNWLYLYTDPYPAYLCDGVKNCADGSDEDSSFCASYDCKSDVPHTVLPSTSEPGIWGPLGDARMRCPGGKGGCIVEGQLCDGVLNCVSDGGSDESDSLCKERGCNVNSLTTLFQCRSGRCMDRFKMCDGRVDCPDGDDEGEMCDRMACPFPRLKCGDNRTCYMVNKRCDGVADCADGADEEGCAAADCSMSFGELCPSGKVCARYTACDGVADCPDASDEDPAFCKTFNCSADGRVQCRDGLHCVKRSDLCNGRKNCPDLSDEDIAYCRTHNCTDEYYGPFPSAVRCPGERFVWCTVYDKLCDGVPGGCYLDEDEDLDFCKSPEVSAMMERRERVMCNNRTGEYTSGRLCDGIVHCEDASDENPSFCKEYKCPEGFVKCYGKVCARGGLCDNIRDCPAGEDEANCSS